MSQDTFGNDPYPEEKDCDDEKNSDEGTKVFDHRRFLAGRAKMRAAVRVRADVNARSGKRVSERAKYSTGAGRSMIAVMMVRMMPVCFMPLSSLECFLSLLDRKARLKDCLSLLSLSSCEFCHFWRRQRQVLPKFRGQFPRQPEESNQSGLIGVNQCLFVFQANIRGLYDDRELFVQL